VVRRDAAGQLQAGGAQPHLLGEPELGDAVPGPGAGQDGGEGDDEDVAEQVVIPEGRVARVRDAGKVVGDVQAGQVGGHGWHARFSPSNGCLLGYSTTLQLTTRLYFLPREYASTLIRRTAGVRVINPANVACYWDHDL